jgi:hypothetical protein
MKEVKIFVEGSSDKNFLIGLFKNIPIEVNDVVLTIEPLGGKDDANFKLKFPIFLTKEMDGINLVIIDSDDNAIAERKDHINQLLNSQNLEAQIFFFPNNADQGELENLLLKIIPEKFYSYWNCFETFDDCVNATKTNNSPSIKDKLHIYCCSLLNDDEVDQRKFLVYPSSPNFMDRRFFNLDSNELFPLMRFLRNNII